MFLNVVSGLNNLEFNSYLLIRHSVLLASDLQWKHSNVSVLYWSKPFLTKKWLEDKCKSQEMVFHPAHFYAEQYRLESGSEPFIVLSTWYNSVTAECEDNALSQGWAIREAKTGKFKWWDPFGFFVAIKPSLTTLNPWPIEEWILCTRPCLGVGQPS